ncbi:polyprenyl synthetase family protein, partial [Anaplasma bovis]|uniref:polyprenyl synthetase family protein n=1 Tax=Anaplasma bovis TaxID=186733 RepID=UPI002FF23EA5
EFIHCATLLHDDVVDESIFRRGVKTSNAIWGNKTSILVGDFLLAVAFQWVVACDSLPIVSVLSDASSIMITGEVQQMVYSKDPNITLSKYLEIISAKTAALFSAACESSAILHDASDAYRHALKQFGYNFGMAFQILDDILDYTATKSDLGKDPGKDLLDKKVTLPLIITYDSLETDERDALQHLLSSSDDIDFHVVYRYMEKCDAIERSRKFALEYADKALSHLHILPDSECRYKLAQFLQSTTQRPC